MTQETGLRQTTQRIANKLLQEQSLLIKQNQEPAQVSEEQIDTKSSYVSVFARSSAEESKQSKIHHDGECLIELMNCHGIETYYEQDWQVIKDALE